MGWLTSGKGNLDLHCLPKPIRRDVVLKGLMSTAAARNNVSACVPDSKGANPHAMCILFLHINDDPGDHDYRLILASNRDEYWDRPTDTAAFRGDKQEWIGGIDLEPGKEGGTWLGMSRSGKLGVLLNVLARQKPNMKGRGNAGNRAVGNFVRDFVTGGKSCMDFLKMISPELHQYNPFHLLLLDLRSDTNCVHYINNSGEDNGIPRTLAPGTYSADNSVIDHPWQKTIHGQKGFKDIVQEHGSVHNRDVLVREIIQLLSDKSTQYFPDPQLQHQFQNVGRPTDYPVIRERSAVCVWSPSIKYGTRTNTIILVDAAGNCEYRERTLCTPVDVDNPTWTNIEYQFTLQ